MPTFASSSSKSPLLTMRRLLLYVVCPKPRYKCRHLLLCLWDNGKSLCICFMQTFIRKYDLRIPSKFKSFDLIFQPHCITIFPRQRRRILEIQYGKSFISKNATSSSGDNCTRRNDFWHQREHRIIPHGIWDYCPISCCIKSIFRKQDEVSRKM